jgi:diaminohydroxyphosphoribosylaminopyrimidine deaminase / 5-amino-6-(5-phosphoribosylamino)uracil reductase
MSTKKDKFTSKDKDYMQLALNLARARKGLTGNNPSVGCVITRQNNIISIGQTSFNGRPHAEHNAIKNSVENLKGTKMYVTLEPCNHYGKTPPCTKIIIKSGISEVYYALDDIDKKVKGKTFKILSKSKIKVKRGLLKQEARELYDSYKINRIKNLPYVTGKIAISKNKLIYSQGTKKITDKTSNTLAHFLRYKNDAIMISSKTNNIDNPRLDCRIKGYENFSPKRIILDKELDIKLNTFIYKTVKKNNTILFHNSTNNSKIRILKKKGITLIKSKVDKNKLFVLKIILKKLYILGIRNLLVEGGDKITKNFLERGLFNQFYLFRSPKKIPIKKNHLSFTSMTLLLGKKNHTKSKATYKLAKDTISIYKR